MDNTVIIIVLILMLLMNNNKSKESFKNEKGYTRHIVNFCKNSDPPVNFSDDEVENIVNCVQCVYDKSYTEVPREACRNLRRKYWR